MLEVALVGVEEELPGPPCSPTPSGVVLETQFGAALMEANVENVSEKHPAVVVEEFLGAVMEKLHREEFEKILKVALTTLLVTSLQKTYGNVLEKFLEFV